MDLCPVPRGGRREKAIKAKTHLSEGTARRVPAGGPGPSRERSCAQSPRCRPPGVGSSHKPCAIRIQTCGCRVATPPPRSGCDRPASPGRAPCRSPAHGLRVDRRPHPRTHGRLRPVRLQARREARSRGGPRPPDRSLLGLSSSRVMDDPYVSDYLLTYGLTSTHHGGPSGRAGRRGAAHHRDPGHRGADHASGSIASSRRGAPRSAARPGSCRSCCRSSASWRCRRAARALATGLVSRPRRGRPGRSRAGLHRRRLGRGSPLVRLLPRGHRSPDEDAASGFGTRSRLDGADRAFPGRLPAGIHGLTIQAYA